MSFKKTDEAEKVLLSVKNLQCSGEDLNLDPWQPT